MSVQAPARDFVCPACTSRVSQGDGYYECSRCARRYPVLFGIPDFRLRSDRYLSLEAERDKARRLFEASLQLSFEQLLHHYYSITDDVPPERAKVFAGYVLGGPARARADLDDFGAVQGNSALLDAGCGAGAALVAGQGRFDVIFGVDIALRWLVICRKRLHELGCSAELVCADIEALPFEPGRFTHIYAADVLEHVYDPGAAVSSLKRQLTARGLLWFSAINRRWLGPHPATGRWAAAFRSAPAGVLDPLRHVRQMSASEGRGYCEDAGLKVLRISPRRVDAAAVRGRSALERAAIGAYSVLSRAPLLREGLVAFGPAFQVLARASERAAEVG